jgi:transcriptional regulator of acetoin/glycerol metabolism
VVERSVSQSDSKHSALVFSTIHSSQAALSAVAASWCRSALHHGLDPARSLRGERLEAPELQRRLAAHGDLLAVAEPVLDRLFAQVGLTGCCVIMADSDGVILQERKSAGDAPFFESSGLVSGSNWSEASEGTNGIGTCLVEARPVTIQRHEHFSARNIAVSCMDAPIFDPAGRLAGALDVSSARADHGDGMASLIGALVQDAARHIERDYFCRHYSGRRIVLAEGARGQALLAVDRDGLVVGATRAARLLYHLGHEVDLAPRPLDDLIGGSAGYESSERATLRQALARSGGNVAAAAKLLGIGRATFYRRMERAGLDLSQE